MNKELFDSMQKQMTPSPQVRAALSEKLAQPVKKRPAPWMKYGAVAACAALMIGAVSVYNLHQVQLDDLRRTLQLHSYVTVEGLTGYVTEDAAVKDTGTGGTEVNAGDLPGGAYVGDVPVQAGAEDYQKLMDHFNGTLPDWYGGAYLNESGWLVVQLVESQDPADKSLELQVLDWTGSDTVMFSSCKYSLNQLNELMEKLNALPEAYPECAKVMAGWGIDEEHNRIELTLTNVDDHVPLLVLAELDPDDDAIYVQVGQRARAEDCDKETPSVQHVVPGGAVAPDDEDLIAVEPWLEDTDGAHYDTLPQPIEDLPASKQPAVTEQSVPEEDVSADTAGCNPNA